MAMKFAWSMKPMLGPKLGLTEVYEITYERFPIVDIYQKYNNRPSGLYINERSPKLWANADNRKVME